MDRDTLRAQLSHYTFYQTIDLGEGIKTPGLPLAQKQKIVLDVIDSMDLSGKRVVDLGCANGLYALAAEKRGAAEILAIDHTRNNIESLNEIIIPHLQSKIKAKQENFFDVSPEEYGQFDLVIFGGLLYHLRYPFWALKVIRDIVRDNGKLILETGVFDDFNTKAKVYCPSPADTPYKGRGGNSCSFFNLKGLTETMHYFGFKIESQELATKPVKRMLKSVIGILHPSYFPTSNVICLCQRDKSLENEELRVFYESTT